MGIAPVSKIASGAHGATIGPVAYVQETKVEQADTFRGALNKIREQHGAMSEQNDILGGNIDYLQGETARMKECASALKEIAGQQQADLDRLNELIEENKKIAAEMRVCLLPCWSLSFLVIKLYTLVSLTETLLLFDEFLFSFILSFK